VRRHRRVDANQGEVGAHTSVLPDDVGPGRSPCARPPHREGATINLFLLLQLFGQHRAHIAAAQARSVCGSTARGRRSRTAPFPHANFAVEAPNRETNALGFERLVPSEHVLVDDGDERALEVQQDRLADLA
jgi:hypothetical protein